MPLVSTYLEREASRSSHILFVRAISIVSFCFSCLSFAFSLVRSSSFEAELAGGDCGEVEEELGVSRESVVALVVVGRGGGGKGSRGATDAGEILHGRRRRCISDNKPSSPRRNLSFANSHLSDMTLRKP